MYFISTYAFRSCFVSKLNSVISGSSDTSLVFFADLPGEASAFSPSALGLSAGGCGSIFA